MAEPARVKAKTAELECQTCHTINTLDLTRNLIWYDPKFQRVLAVAKSMVKCKKCGSEHLVPVKYDANGRVAS
jgi:Zn finger protein HypA/HybF involved in hydrogenase expression